MQLSILLTCVFLSMISGLLLPMTKPDGTVDLTSLLSHVTFLEQSFQTKTTQFETEMQSTNTDLQVTKAKLAEITTDFKSYQLSSTAEITSLKDELAAVKGELGLMTNEVISVKTEMTNLKKESIKGQFNNTVINTISHDIKSNMEKLKPLETDLQSVMLIQDKTNTSMELFLTALVEVNKTVTETQQQQAQMKTEISKLISLQNQLQSNISSTVSEVSIIKDSVLIVQSQMITTKDEIIVVKSTIAKLGNDSGIVKDKQRKIDIELSNVSSVLNQVKSNEVSTAGSVSLIKQELRTVQSQLSTTTGDISRIRSEVTTHGRNISVLAMTSLGNSQSLTQLSQNLAQTRRDVSFLVYLSTSDGSDPLIFTSVKFNAGHGYSMTTGKFTAPVSGTYIFLAQLELYSSGTHQQTYIQIKQASSTISSGYGETTTDLDDITISATAITHMTQGQEVWVRSDIVHFYTSSAASLFTGALLSPD